MTKATRTLLCPAAVPKLGRTLEKEDRLLLPKPLNTEKGIAGISLSESLLNLPAQRTSS